MLRFLRQPLAPSIRALRASYPYVARFPTPAVRKSSVSGARSLTSVQHIPKKRRWPLYVLLGTVLGGYGYWKYLTHHNFPPTVAALLKEGLWATINGAGYRKPDYKVALVKYIEALQEADRLKMVPWSDEYTGIQIIIADLYERLDLVEEAASMYAEVATSLMMALNSNAVPASERGKLITRDLRVVLLAALLVTTDAHNLKSVAEFVGPHLVLATREAAAKSEELQFMLSEYPVFNVGYLRDIADKRLPTDLFSECWGPFKSELFALREMMTGVAAANGEYMQALMIKLKTTQIMLASDFPVGECLLSAVNIASLMYLQAMNMKFSVPKAAAASGNAASAGTVARNTSADGAGANGAGANGGDANSDGLLSNKANSDSELPAVKLSGLNGQKAGPSDQAFLELSRNVYSEIINTVQKLDQRRTDFIPEAYAMALYGKGVVASSQGNWDLAADCMSEARLRAKGSQLQPLIEAVEGEIDKVEAMRGLTPEQISQLNPSEIPSIDIMFWKLTPDIGDLNRPELPDPKL